jgi:hypothetical protein
MMSLFECFKIGIELAIFLLLAGCGAAQDIQQNFKTFLKSAWSVETLVSPGVTAAASQWIAKPAGFGTGAEGYFYHYGVSLGDNVNGKFMRNFVFPTLTGKPDEYSAAVGKSSGRRVLNIAGHTLFLHPLDPSRTSNWSGALASFASAGLSNAYQPSAQRTWSATFQRFGTNSAGYAIGDALKEFKPDLCRNRILGGPVLGRVLCK